MCKTEWYLKFMDQNAVENDKQRLLSQEVYVLIRE